MAAMSLKLFLQALSSQRVLSLRRPLPLTLPVPPLTIVSRYGSQEEVLHRVRRCCSHCRSHRVAYIRVTHAPNTTTTERETAEAYTIPQLGPRLRCSYV